MSMLVPACLLHLEDVLVEVLLQLLIGQVDAKLLKVVLLEALEAIDVQHAHDCSCVGVLQWRRRKE